MLIAAVLWRALDRKIGRIFEATVRYYGISPGDWLPDINNKSTSSDSRGYFTGLDATFFSFFFPCRNYICSMLNIVS